LEITTSAVGYSDENGDITDVENKLTLTLDAKHMRDLSEFLSRIAWRMKDSKDRVKQPS
jgi:hypothetical protein